MRATGCAPDPVEIGLLPDLRAQCLGLVALRRGPHAHPEHAAGLHGDALYERLKAELLQAIV